MVDSSLKVALVQQRLRASRQDNLQASEVAVRQAAEQGAQLVVLQELHAGGYFCQTENTELFDQAESIPGAITRRFADLARALGVVIVTSVFEKRAAGVYHNSAAVLDADGSLAGVYRKMHIPDDPGYYEKFYFTPGDAPGFQPIDTSVGRLGVLVCWDQWFPEAARLMALAGAQVLIYPTAIGFDPDDSKAEQQRQQDAWITIQRSHAIANALPVLACNRVGFEPDPSGATAGARFWGKSFIAGPQGEVIAQASGEDEEVLVAPLELGRTETVRRIWPFLRDRRIDAYEGLTRRLLDENP